MKMNRFILGALVLLAVFVIPTASTYPTNSTYFVPENSNVSGYCQSVDVDVYYNASVPLCAGSVNITYTHCCANVTNWVRDAAWPMGTWDSSVDGREWICFLRMAPGVAGVQRIGTLTIHGCNPSCCMTNLTFDTGTELDDCPGAPLDFTPYNGTFACETPPQIFSKDLYAGWNLVSLPLVPGDNSTSSVLASVWEDVTAVFRYDAITKQFENARDTTMDPGTGYFVHVTESCTWNYNGYAWADDIPLKQGLNMIGWRNCTKPISDALSSIAGDYYYAAKWNAVEQKFETYNPAAPNGFNDFFDMDRGTGYFISAKSDVTLSESCVA